MGPRRAFSLSNELHLLINGVDGIRELANRLTESSFIDVAEPLQIVAAATLVRERLLLLDRAVRGQVDPRLLRCRENEVPDEPTTEESDVVLGDRSDKDGARHHRREWKAAKRRLRRKRGDR